MKAKYIQRGETIDYINHTAAIIEPGDIVKFGGRVGIAATRILIGELGTLNVIGVYQVLKKTGEEHNLGDKIYLAEDGATKTETDSLIGYAVSVSTENMPYVAVKID